MIPSHLLEVIPDTAARDALQQALDAYENPARQVLVAGRQSVGKSSLVNALTQSTLRKTGLGGVTQELASLPLPAHDEVTVIDTPGLEHPADARRLATQVGASDLVIWLVDGLQPLGSSARLALAELLGPLTALVLLVTRLDLVEAGDRAEVLERVRVIAKPFKPSRILTGSPRSFADDGLSSHSFLEHISTVHRTPALLAALRRVQSSLPDSPPADSILRRRWREHVQAFAPDDLTSPDPTPARMHLAEFLSEATRTAPHLFARRGLPELPLPPSIPTSRLRDQLGGTTHADRTVRRAAAAWAADGLLALALWADRAPDPIVEMVECVDARIAELQALASRHPTREGFSSPRR